MDALKKIVPRVGALVWMMSRNSADRITFLVDSYRWSGGPNNISIKPHLRLMPKVA